MMKVLAEGMMELGCSEQHAGMAGHFLTERVFAAMEEKEKKTVEENQKKTPDESERKKKRRSGRSRWATWSKRRQKTADVEVPNAETKKRKPKD